MADPKAYRLETSRPGVKFVVIYMRTVGTQTDTRISHLGPATAANSDWFEFLVMPVSCKRIGKKFNVWRPIDTNSCQSHVNTP